MEPIRTLINLWLDYQDQSIDTPTFPKFMDWLQDNDTKAGAADRHSQGHVEGRRITCLNKAQILSLLDEVDPKGTSWRIDRLRDRVGQL